MGNIFIPFIIAGLLAYLGDPLVNRLTQWHLPRTLSAVIVFLAMLTGLVGLAFLFIPLLEDQIEILVLKTPEVIMWIQSTVLPWLQTHFDIKANLDVNQIKSVIISHWQQTSNIVDKILKTLTNSTFAIIAFIINLFLTPVVTFYLLKDWPKLLLRMKNLIPRKYLTSVTETFRECNEVLGAFFRGQFLVMLALGIIYSIGFMVIGLDFALLIAVMIAILSIVPYLGTITGLLVAVGVTLYQFHDVIHLVYVLALFLGGNIFESMVLTPWLVGGRVGLHPVAVIFAILLGGALFGFFGILLAIPVAAVVLVLLKILLRKYKNSVFYKE
jgi:predicted PurR-regulated permease PerM